jgi:hypothetical protein
MNSSATDPSTRTLTRAGSSALTAVLPELGALRASSGAGRRLIVLILGGTAVFCVVVGVAVFVLLGKEEKSARRAATSFATALVHNDPGAAPAGAGGDVGAVRAAFGPVTGATVIAAHNHAVNTGDVDTRNYYVADLLLRTRRGPAVIELSFDNHSLSSQEVTGIRELTPGDVSLSPTDHAGLEAAFAARGGRAADLSAVATAGTQIAVPPAGHVADAVAPARVTVDPALGRAAAQLRCVQRARGDVAKLQACS